MSWGSNSRLDKQRSCSAFAMEVGNWCNSRCGSMRNVNGVNDFEECTAMNMADSRSSMPKWRWFWKRIKKEKRRIFDYPSSGPSQVPYDPYTYSQNFDQGTAWTEPDNLSRSFSARFADPSRIFQRNAAVMS
ncbi:hypothetical protein Sjap_019875 [Stephania japonica]|uniref:Uncharacterized protein n=1 Tax=Stephania japonica TaxID=461633 RepID=A0AAP0EZL4_9MAGN